MAIIFPENPVLGQQYLPTNTVTYIWTGDRWSSAIPIHNGSALYAIEGLDAELQYSNYLDNTIDGGGA